MQKCKFFIVTIQQFSNKNLISNASHCIIICMYLEEAGNKESFRLVFYFILSLSIWFTNAWLEYFQFRCFLSIPWPCMYVKRVYDLNYVSKYGPNHLLLLFIYDKKKFLLKKLQGNVPKMHDLCLDGDLPTYNLVLNQRHL